MGCGASVPCGFKKKKTPFAETQPIAELNEANDYRTGKEIVELRSKKESNEINDLKNDLKNGLRNDIKNALKNEMKNGPKNDAKNDAKIDLKDGKDGKDGKDVKDESAIKNGRHRGDVKSTKSRSNSKDANDKNAGEESSKKNNDRKTSCMMEKSPGSQSEKYQHGVKFAVGTPTFVGDNVTPCFANGLLYRIIKGDTWAFFNDTRVYEMHIGLVFDKASMLQALGDTKMNQLDETGEYSLETIVYPGETAMYAKGIFAGFKSKIHAFPLSEEYLKKKVNHYNKLISPELERVGSFADETKTDEDILAQCVLLIVSFIDVKFPPNQNSISGGSEWLKKTVPWARPNMYLPEHLFSSVRLFRNVISPLTVDPGELGDIWLVCAIAAFAEYPGLVRNMFCHPVNPQLTAKELNLGAHRVTLNKSGWWHNVIVDDYLPVVCGRPKYAKSAGDPCELWVSILEKAYAKLHGCYANIVVGDPLMAIQDFTGFPTARFDELFAQDIKTGGTEFFESLENYFRSGYQIIINTPVRDSKNAEMEGFFKEAGLRMGYAYPVRAVCHFPNENVYLMQICNPWSGGIEWKGEWGENDSAWERHQEIAKACGHGTPQPGTFWMSWDDVKKYFTGCGVVFYYQNNMDYRIRGVFNDGFPDVCLQLTVKKRATVVFILSQEDRRSLGEIHEDEYPPIMLSLGCGRGSFRNMQVVQNSDLSVVNPTTELTFSRARDVAMLCTLTPDCSPYLLVPRIFSNEGSFPYVIGILSGSELSTDVKASLCTLSQDNEIFTNSLSFPGESVGVSSTFQVRRPGGGFPQVYTGKEILKYSALERAASQK